MRHDLLFVVFDWRLCLLSSLFCIAHLLPLWEAFTSWAVLQVDLGRVRSVPFLVIWEGDGCFRGGLKIQFVCAQTPSPF